MSEEEIEILKDFLELKEIHSNNSVTKSYLSIYQETVKKLYATCETQQKEIEELKEKTKKCEYYEMVADELSKEIEELKAINQMQKYRIEVIDERELISKDKLIELREIDNIDLIQCKLRKLLEE